MRAPDPIPRDPASHSGYLAIAPALRAYSLRAMPDPVPGFHEVFVSRRSDRRLGRGRLKDVLGCLGYATQALFVREEAGVLRSRRPALASGALHAVTPILITGSRAVRIWQCRPDSATVVQLQVLFPTFLRAFRSACAHIVPAAASVGIVVLVGDQVLLAENYEHHETLMWRDAGAMLQTLALAATAYGLGYCPLAPLGTEVLEGMGSPSRFCALGVALIGVSAK